MGQRYSKLPSELFAKADTFDLMVMDVALTYHKYHSNKQNKHVDQSMYDTGDLQEKLNKFREKNG